MPATEEEEEEAQEKFLSGSPFCLERKLFLLTKKLNTIFTFALLHFCAAFCLRNLSLPSLSHRAQCRRRKFVEEHRGDTEGVGYIKTRSERQKSGAKTLEI